MRFRRLAAAIAEQRLLIGQGQDFPDTDFVFVPFENQRSIGFQDAEAPNDLGPRKGRATVPINDSLMAALQTAKLSGVSDYVIEWGGRKVGSIKTGFNAAVKRAGIAHCTRHDLRRTAGRFMAEAGVPIEEIAEYLGHSNPNITRATYARFSPQRLRKAAGALEIRPFVSVRQTKGHIPL